VDPRNEYVPVRLGELNAQTRWVLERSGATEPELLPHVLLRVGDVMRTRFPLAAHRDPVREVGLVMAQDDVDLVPVVDDNGALAGAVTERALMCPTFASPANRRGSMRRRPWVRSPVCSRGGSWWASGSGDRGTRLGARHGD